MKYSIRIKKSAEKYVNSLESRIQALLNKKLDPFDIQHSKPLVNMGGKRSARLGQLRIIFSVDRDKKEITIEAIDSRGQVYNRLD